MRFLSQVSVVCILLILSYVSGCNRDSQAVIVNRSSAIKQFASDNGAELFRGKVDIATNSNGIVVFVTNGEAIVKPLVNGKPTQFAATQAFVLQRESSSSNKAINESSFEAEVMKLPSMLLISRLDNKESYLITINDSNAENIKTKLPESLRGYQSYQGYGLSYRTGSITSSSAQQYQKDMLAKLDMRVNGVTGEGEATICESGGEGATSCSSSHTTGSLSYGCSVNCSSGYYACCSNGSSCNCEKNKP